MSATGSPQKFRPVRVLLGEPYLLQQPDGVSVPVVRARLITENGQLWARVFLAFGLTEARVREAWDREHEKFLKL